MRARRGTKAPVTRQRVRHRLLGTDDLVHAFVDGDVDALDELVRRHRQVPLGAARRHLCSSAEVEDVAQETWFRFTVHAAEIREPARLASWLWATAANEARRLRRRAARLQLVDGFDDLSAHPPEEEAAVTTPERRKAVRRAVRARLNERERQLLVLLMDARDLGYEHISRVCVRPVGGIGPTRARIIRKLRSHPDVARLCGAAA